MLNIKLYHVNKSKSISYLIDVNYERDTIVLIFDNIDYDPLTEDIHKLCMKLA